VRQNTPEVKPLFSHFLCPPLAQTDSVPRPSSREDRFIAVHFQFKKYARDRGIPERCSQDIGGDEPLPLRGPDRDLFDPAGGGDAFYAHSDDIGNPYSPPAKRSDDFLFSDLFFPEPVLGNLLALAVHTLQVWFVDAPEFRGILRVTAAARMIKGWNDFPAIHENQTLCFPDCFRARGRSPLPPP